MDFKIITDLGYGYVIIFFILSAFVSWFFYRNSDLPQPKKSFLIALRFLSVFLIFLLLANPVLAFIKSQFIKSSDVFLIDVSESLNIQNRKDSVITYLQNGTSSGNARYILFSNGIYKDFDELNIDSVKFSEFDNFETNLSTSLNELTSQLNEFNISSVNIISDGIINKGGNPLFTAKGLGVPFNYFLIGDTIQQNDLVLKNIFFNKTAYIESLTPVKVVINAFGYSRSISVNIYEENNLLETRYLEVSPAKTEYELEFKLTSASESIRRYKIEVVPLKDEITTKNNATEFFVKFIDNKFRLLVISGAPSSDYAFLKEELAKVKNFEVSYLTQKSADSYYEKEVPDLSNVNCFLLIGFPTEISNINLLNDIKRYSELNKASVFFIASRNIDYSRLSVLESILPFKTGFASQNEEVTSIKSVSSINQNIFSSPEIFSVINNLPPVFKTSSVFIPSANSETFLIASNNSQPAFLMKRDNVSNSAAFLFYGFYKWKLNPLNIDAGRIFNYLISNTIFSISDKEKQKKLIIESEKDVYSKYEPVKIKAKINNINSAEFNGGKPRIELNVTNNGTTQKSEMRLVDNENYEAVSNLEKDGTYNLKADLYSNNNLIASDEIKILIGENNFEYIATRSDESVLKELAFNTSGVHLKSLSNSERSDFYNKLQQSSDKKITESLKEALNINPFYLGIILFLLCLEWFLRKRNNLP
jgi:hypothetical protein